MTVKRPNIKLYADRVLVSIIPAEEIKTKSGIIIPETANKDERTQYGKVVRVSAQVEEAEHKWEQISEGETVMFSQYAGSALYHESKEYKVLRFTDIYGAIE